MILQYGSYEHENCEVELQIDKRTLFTDAMTPWAEEHIWKINGRIKNVDSNGDATADSGTLTTLIEELVDSYTSGQDAILYLPDGTTQTAHKLISDNAIGGVRVTKPPHFLDGKGAQYVTFRTYSIELAATFELADPITAIMAFTETVDFSGGGPRFGFLEPLNGRPVKQLLKQATVYRCVQRGQAVGISSYPLESSPLWPSALMENPRISKGSPRRYGSSYREFPISWEYVFESDVSMRGNPRRWTVA